MKFTLICLASCVCLLLIGPSEEQGPIPPIPPVIDWEIAKIQYFQAKLMAIKQKMVNDIQFIAQLEQAVLQAVIDALRRLQNMRTTIRSTGTIKETAEELQQLFDHCEDLIRKYEQIQREKASRLNLAGVEENEKTAERFD